MQFSLSKPKKNLNFFQSQFFYLNFILILIFFYSQNSWSSYHQPYPTSNLSRWPWPPRNPFVSPAPWVVAKRPSCTIWPKLPAAVRPAAFLPYSWARNWTPRCSSDRTSVRILWASSCGSPVFSLRYVKNTVYSYQKSRSSIFKKSTYHQNSIIDFYFNFKILKEVSKSSLSRS